MPEHEQDAAADAGEAINDIRRFVWAAGDMVEAQERTADRLEKVRAAFNGAREALQAASEQARRLAQDGVSIDRSDMNTIRSERIALAEALHETFGEVEAIRERFWMGALLIGIAGGAIGGGIAVLAPYIIRGITA